MCKRNDSALFFTCSLVEQLGRSLHAKRGDIVSALGAKGIQTIYEHADVLHCEPIEKVADDAITEFRLTGGAFTNTEGKRFSVPDVWTMGKVYARLIEDISNDSNVVDTLVNIYTSWIDERLSDYNSAFYYQPRDYIAECFRAGVVLD